MKSISKFQPAEALWKALKGTLPGSVKLINRRRGKGAPAVTYENWKAAELEARLEECRTSGLEAYLLVGDTDGTGFKADNVLSARAVAVDVDVPDFPLRWLRDHPYRPSIATETSPGRYHFIWLLTEPCTPGRLVKAAKVLSMRIDGDMLFANPCQAVRIPGLLNAKNDHGVRLLGRAREDLTYDLDKLLLAFDEPLIARHLRRALPSLTDSLTIPKHQATEPKSERIVLLRSALRHIPSDDYGAWYRFGLALKPLKEDGFELWREWSAKSPKYDEAECREKWAHLGAPREIKLASIFFAAVKNGWSWPQQEAWARTEPDWSERAIGRLIANRLRQDCVGVVAQGKTLLSATLHRWNGFLYGALAQHEARQLVEKVGAHLAGDLDATAAKSVRALIGRTNSLDALVATVAESLIVSEADFVCDRYPYLPVANGVINLLSGDLVPSEYRPLSTRSANVSFNPRAEAPLFVKVLSQLQEGDGERIAFILRVLAYALLGKPVEHVVPIFVGDGRNGKSLILNLMQDMFGDFACSMSPAAILAKSHNNDSATPSLAKTLGRRLVVVTEPSPKHPVDAALLKQMAGGDRMQARALHGQQFEFKPEFVMMIALNRLPNMPTDDGALWRRILAILWPVAIPPGQEDRELGEKLLREASGILNILLRALRDYQANGLDAPESVDASGRELRLEMDIVGQWLEERTVTGDSNKRTKLADLFADFQDFAEASKLPSMSKQEFSRRLGASGFKKVVLRNLPWFDGVQLRDA